MEIHRKTVLVDGLVTSYLEAGAGDPVVMLHGGEFGASAELGWERNIAELAAHHRVLAPDLLGFGQSAKVIDFVDGRGLRIRHVARFRRPGAASPPSASSRRPYQRITVPTLLVEGQ